MGIADTLVKITSIKAKEKLAESAILTVGKFAEGTIKHASNAVASYMDKNNIRYVYVPQSAETYIGQNYLDVQTELHAYGFENINLLEKRVLWNVRINAFRVNKVVSVSIGGKDSFKKKQRFRSDDQVVIVYQTFRS